MRTVLDSHIKSRESIYLPGNICSIPVFVSLLLLPCAITEVKWTLDNHCSWEKGNKRK